MVLKKYEGQSFNKRGWLVSSGTAWLDWLRVITEFGEIDAINYTPAPAVTPSLGKSRSMDLNLIFKLHPQWKLEERILWNDLKKNSAVGGESVFRNLMFRSEIDISDDAFLGFRMIADYHSLASNRKVSSLESGKQLNTDFQVNYTLSPGTSIIAGYGNRQENLAQIGNPSYLVRTEDLLIAYRRRAFIKLNYLYQF